MKQIFFIIVLSSMLLGGCSNLPQQSTPFIDIGIQYSVAKIVANSPNPSETAVRLTTIADQILANNEAQIPVNAIHSAISAYFPLENLAPEDQFLISALTASFSNYVLTLNTPESALITSHMIARYIKFGASFYLPK